MSNNFQNNAVQEESTTAKPAEPSLCTGCFEFFGNPANENLCSSCFKNKQKAKTQPPVTSIITEAVAAEVSDIQQENIEQKPLEEKKEQEVPKQADTSKCFQCKKKVGLLGYPCKCGSTFCKLHRLPEEHECDFDFCSKEREKLKRANPIVAAPKLVKF